MKTRWKDTKLVISVIRYFLVFLFIYAGLTKILEGNAFYNNLYNSPLLPKHKDLIGVLAWAIPILELLTAVFLLSFNHLQKAFLWVLGLLCSYCIYIASILWWAPYQPCSCGGVVTLLSWEQHLGLNGFFIGLTLMGLYLEKGQSRSKDLTYQTD